MGADEEMDKEVLEEMDEEMDKENKEATNWGDIFLWHSYKSRSFL